MGGVAICIYTYLDIHKNMHMRVCICMHVYLSIYRSIYISISLCKNCYLYPSLYQIVPVYLRGPLGELKTLVGRVLLLPLPYTGAPMSSTPCSALLAIPVTYLGYRPPLHSLKEVTMLTHEALGIFSSKTVREWGQYSRHTLCASESWVEGRIAGEALRRI